MLEVETHNEVKKITDVLFDENNTAPILLNDAQGNHFSAEQLFVSEYDGVVYCILAPLNVILETQNSAFVFRVDGEALRLETDKDVCSRAFKDYHDALSEI